jgi:hypothetical protein
MVGIFVLIDALGWAYLKDRDFLPEVLSYRTEVQTVLGFSSGAIPTLLSGKQPRESGHWNLFYYDPDRSPFRWLRNFSWLPSALLNNRAVRRVVRLVSQRLSRFGGYFQIYGVPVELLPYFDICEKDDIYRPGGVPGSIFDSLQESGLRFCSYSYHDCSDEEIIRRAGRDLKAGQFDFYFIYLSEMDAFLHRWCADEPRVENEIRRYEKLLRGLYAEAGAANDEVDFFVCSDHGMTPKHAGYDLLAQMNSVGLQMPRDYLALYDSTMARFWFFNEPARDAIIRKLKQLDCGRILSLDEQRRFGIDFCNNRYGDVIFLMNTGVLIEPSFMGTRAPDGMHGFDPEQDEYASAAFLANRRPKQPVRTLIDVHSVMLDWIDSARGVAHVGR